jgi:hypothetical protein
MTLPVDRFLNAVHVWALAHVKPEQRDEWLFKLQAPIPGKRPPESAVAEEMEAFGAFAGAFGVSRPTTG